MTTAQKPDALPVVAWRIRYRSEPEMIGYYPWSYTERMTARLAHNEYEPLVRLSDAQASLLAKEAEIERLKQCVKWYADGNHFSLDDWEAPDEPGWLSPPNDESWMVEDGSVARTVLNGGHMVTDDDIIAEPLMSKEAYEGALGRVRELVALDPQPDTQQGRALSVLAAAVERYEKRMFPGMPIDAARAAADQGGA